MFVLTDGDYGASFEASPHQRLNVVRWGYRLCARATRPFRWTISPGPANGHRGLGT